MLRLMALFYEIHAVAGRDNAWVIPVFYSCFTDAFWITLTRGCMFWRDQKNGSFGINNYNCILHQLVLILSPPDPLSIHTFLVWDFFFSILKSCALDPCFFWQMIFGSKKQVFDTYSCMLYLEAIRHDHSPWVSPEKASSFWKKIVMVYCCYPCLIGGGYWNPLSKSLVTKEHTKNGIEFFGCSIWTLKNCEIQWSETLTGHSRIFWKSGAQCNVARRSWWIDLWIFVDRVSGGCAKRIRDHLSHIPSFDILEFF